MLMISYIDDRYHSIGKLWVEPPIMNFNNAATGTIYCEFRDKANPLAMM